jgi:hypothetical protein
MAFGAQPYSQLPIITPRQANIKGAAGTQALQTLQGLGGANFNFEPIAQKARTNFNENTIPGLAERFTQFGSGANRSSAFQGALGQAGSNLNEGLAALEQQFGQKQQGLQQNLLSMLLQHSQSPEFKNLKNDQGQGGGNDLQSFLDQIFGNQQEGQDGQEEQQDSNQGFSWKSLFGSTGLGPKALRILGNYFGGQTGADIGEAGGNALENFLNKIRNSLPG